MRALAIAVATAVLLTPGGAGAAAPSPATPLFASDDTIRVTLRGPINSVARTSARGNPAMAVLTVPGARPETHNIRLSARGITRRKPGTCQFAPLRVEFIDKPAAASLFSGQRRLKLVTHCRNSAPFQQYLLLEYAAYRLFNHLTPASFRVRLATIDYASEDGRPIMTRFGFFIEDVDDAGKRNGMREAPVGDRIAADQLSPRDAARAALFNYMIGNLDWSMTAGSPGEGCCHNFRLVAPAGRASGIVPLPYDFDFSGMVDAPYAVPPDASLATSVKSRRYRGYCRHNSEAEAIAAEFRNQRGALEAVLSAVPQLEARSRRKASSYLAGFFDQIRDVGSVRNVLKTCVDR